MTWEWAALGALALLALVLLVALLRLRARTAGELARARTAAEELRRRLDRLEQQQVRPEVPVVRDEREYSITRFGDDADETAPVPRAVFADTVLREGVIRLGSLAHGVRRALGPEARNRIRFEMRREVRRARKQRRADSRAAQREVQARRRAAATEGDLPESA